jgi:hypothetical protein
MLLQPEIGPGLDVPNVPGMDKTADSLGHAVQICLDLHRAKADA